MDRGGGGWMTTIRDHFRLIRFAANAHPNIKSHGAALKSWKS